MSDGIKWVKAKDYWGVTGQTYRNPISKKGVRMYELAIMNNIKNNQRINWLGYDSKFGRVYVGLHSRYDVPGRMARKYAKLKEELLVHGTPKYPLGLYFNRGIKVTKSKNVRGGEGLYVQPPVTYKPSKIPTEESGYVGLSYLKLGKVTGSEYTVNPFTLIKRRGMFILKDKVGNQIKLTKKALRGKESEQAVRFGETLKPTGRRQHM